VPYVAGGSNSFQQKLHHTCGSFSFGVAECEHLYF
jgi:hypothetical protein